MGVHAHLDLLCQKVRGLGLQDPHRIATAGHVGANVQRIFAHPQGLVFCLMLLLHINAPFITH